MRHHSFLSGLLIAFFLSACGGRVPTETIIHQYGDESMRCGDIEAELDIMEKKADVLMKSSDKTTRNLGLLALSIREPVGILFMDLSLADKRELTALRKRYNYLVGLALEKGCAPPPKPPEDLPADFNERMQQKEPAGTH
jgi:hypothetical protein